MRCCGAAGLVRACVAGGQRERKDRMVFSGCFPALRAGCSGGASERLWPVCGCDRTCCLCRCRGIRIVGLAGLSEIAGGGLTVRPEMNGITVRKSKCPWERADRRAEMEEKILSTKKNGMTVVT